MEPPKYLGFYIRNASGIQNPFTHSPADKRQRFKKVAPKPLELTA